MLKRVKQELKQLLPVDADKPHKLNPEARQFITLSLKRSGQHAVINWLCHQAQNIVHFNHCYFERRHVRNFITPVNSRVIYYTHGEKHDSGIQDRLHMDALLAEIGHYDNLLYSFEDYDVGNELLRKYIYTERPTVVLILRDPYNWLASTMRRKDCTREVLESKIGKYTRYLELALGVKSCLNHPVCTINYNKWAIDLEYRKNVCSLLGLAFSSTADRSTCEVPDFGGGSSFDGLESSSSRSRDGYFQRWQEFVTDPLYIELLNDNYLVKLAESYFQTGKPF